MTRLAFCASVFCLYNHSLNFAWSPTLFDCSFSDLLNSHKAIAFWNCSIKNWRESLRGSVELSEVDKAEEAIIPKICSEY